MWRNWIILCSRQSKMVQTVWKKASVSHKFKQVPIKWPRKNSGYKEMET